MELVTRLRDYQQWLDDDGSTDDFVLDVTGDKTCARAANEIERLEKELALAQGIRGVSYSADKLWEIKKLEYEQSKLTEEIGRLKERDVRPLVFRRIEITDQITKLIEDE